MPVQLSMKCLPVIEDHMLDWHSCQIRYPLEIKLLLLLLLSLLSCQVMFLEIGIRHNNHSRSSCSINEPRHDKNSKTSVRPAKTQISLGIRPVWSESPLSAWRKLGSLATHWAHSEDSEQTGPRLIWVFAGRTVILLVLSCRGPNK